MKTLLLLMTICVLTSCKDLIVGDNTGAVIHEETIAFYGIPYFKRTHEFFYSNIFHTKIKVSRYFFEPYFVMCVLTETVKSDNKANV